jgi:DNA-directed RNA polymerase subunit RPC12/RpoP
MVDKCPGSEKRNIKPEEIKCPFCGEILEIFSDEIRVWCPNCKKYIFRKGKTSDCFDWCPYADKCKLDFKSEKK